MTDFFLVHLISREVIGPFVMQFFSYHLYMYKTKKKLFPVKSFS